MSIQFLRMIDIGTGPARGAWSIPAAAPRSNVLQPAPLPRVGKATFATFVERRRSAYGPLHEEMEGVNHARRMVGMADEVVPFGSLVPS